jgi:hypothetical protein
MLFAGLLKPTDLYDFGIFSHLHYTRLFRKALNLYILVNRQSDIIFFSCSGSSQSISISTSLEERKQNVKMPASSPNHAALLAITQRSKSRKQQLEQARRKLDLESEELCLQRRRLELHEKEIATKREELNLTLVENAAYMTMVLDRDVQELVVLSRFNPTFKGIDQVQQVQQVYTGQEAIEPSEVAEHSDSSATEVLKKPIEAVVLKADPRAGRTSSTPSRKEVRTAAKASSSIGYARIFSGRNCCKGPFNDLRGRTPIEVSTAAVRTSSSSKVSRMEKNGMMKGYRKQHGSLQNKLKRGPGPSNAIGPSLYRLRARRKKAKRLKGQPKRGAKAEQPRKRGGPE